ncbi:MAG: hypothetical protein HYX56_06650, partial [Chloroflexi bacterium]|nr:hypothetical protein [Chloroflexota bacterium]
ANAAVGQFGNFSAASTSTDNTVTHDTVVPTVTINQGSVQADPTNGASVVYDIVFSESVTGFTASDVAVSYTGPGALTRSLTGSGAVYQLSISGMTPGTQGTFTATIPAAVATDPAGNAIVASTSADNSITFDNVRPTVGVVKGGTQVDPTNGAAVVFDVVFSEPASGFTASDVTLTTPLTGLSVAVSPVGGFNTNYTVTVTGMAANTQGPITVSIPAGGAADLATNTNTASPTSATVQFDAVRPTVTIDQAAGQADPANGSITYTVVFSEPVTGFTAADVDLTLTGSLAGLTPTVGVSGSGTTYTVTVTGFPADVQGTVTASVPAGGVVDLASNTNVASTSTDATVGFDSVRPTVTIDQAATQLDPTRFQTVQYTVVFSEAVTGFTAADVQLSLGGTLAGLTPAVAVTGSGTTYTVTVTGLPLGGLGKITADVVDSAAIDAAGNATVASTSVDNAVLYDNDRPQFTVTQSAGQADPTRGPAIVFDVVFREPVSGFDAADVTLGGTLPGVGGLTAVVAGSGDTYTVTVTGMQPGTQGTVVANVASGVATDAAGNTNLAPSTSDNVVTFDAQAPGVAVTRAATQPDRTNQPTILFAVAFSEPVTGFDAADVVLGGTLQGAAGLSAVVTGSGATYTVAVTGMNPGLGT